MCYSQYSISRCALAYTTPHACGNRKLDEKTLPFSLLENEGRRLPLGDKLNLYSPQPTVLAAGGKPAKATGGKQKKNTKVVFIRKPLRLSKLNDMLLDTIT